MIIPMRNVTHIWLIWNTLSVSSIFVSSRLLVNIVWDEFDGDNEVDSGISEMVVAPKLSFTNQMSWTSKNPLLALLLIFLKYSKYKHKLFIHTEAKSEG